MPKKTYRAEIQCLGGGWYTFNPWMIPRQMSFFSAGHHPRIQAAWSGLVKFGLTEAWQEEWARVWDNDTLVTIKELGPQLITKIIHTPLWSLIKAPLNLESSELFRGCFVCSYFNSLICITECWRLKLEKSP